MDQGEKSNFLHSFVIGKFMIGLLAGLVGIIFLIILFIITTSSLITLGESIGFNSDTGPIGDTIAGTLGPAIASVAAVLTFLAFFVQYKANQQQKKDLAKERFESKFFEMLNLHKENINEMSIEGYDVIRKTRNTYNHEGGGAVEESTEQVSKQIAGRKIFVTSYYELFACYQICKTTLNFEDIIDKERYLIKLSYKLLFNGVGNDIIKSNDNTIENDKEYVTLCKKALLAARKKHIATSGEDQIYKFPGSNIKIAIPIKYKPFSGHSSRLGHYYRHLYLMVRYVVNQHNNLFEIPEKREYLRILRAQLSGHEQLMLYFNYLSGYGKNWENSMNRFFSDFRMIHNIPLELTEFTISPRDEFKTQIQLIKESGEEMFEYDEA